MNRSFIRRNITSTAIVIFVILFCIVQTIKPSFMFNMDGSPKIFGLGNKRKTVIPIWLISLILAILSYLFVLYYLAIPKLDY